MNRSRLFGSLLAAVAVLTLARTAAAQSIPVTVGGEASSLVGVPFELPVQVDMSGRSDKLGSFVVRLQWNPAVLKLNDGHPGTFGEMQTNEDSIPLGVLRISGANPAGVTGRVTVGVGVMVPLTTDTTTVRVSVKELYAAQTFDDMLSDAVPSNRLYCNARGRWGDIDADLAVNSRDALIALSAAVGLPVGGYDVGLGDVDGNSATEARDALIMLSAAVGLDIGTFRVLHIAPGPCSATFIPHLVVGPGSTDMLVGQEVHYAAHLRDASGNNVSAPDVFWHTSDDQTASVTPGGLVLAVAPGTVTITAHQSGGETASVTVTVLAHRKTHWVDAFALNHTNQVGSTLLPFSTIGQALELAEAADTVRIRAGRYEESLYLQRDVVLQGESSGGRDAVIVPLDSAPVAILVNTPHAYVRNLTLDGFAIGIDGPQTIDTLWADSLRFFGASNGCDDGGAIVAQSVGTLVLQHARLVGSSAVDCEGATDYGVLVASAGRVRIEDASIADFGQDGVSFSNIDSLVILRTNISGSGGNGVDVGAYNCVLYCAPPLRSAAMGASATSLGLAIQDSRFVNNYREALSASDLRFAVISGTFIAVLEGDALDLSAHDNTATLTLSADSIRFPAGASNDAPPVLPVARSAGSASYCCGATWITADGFARIDMNGVRVIGALDGDFNDIGRLTVTNSSLTELGIYGTAFDVNTYEGPRTILQFDSVYLAAAATSCFQCIDGLRANYAGGTINRFRAEGLDVGIEVGDSSLKVTNSAFHDVTHPVSAYSSGAERWLLEVRSSTFSGTCQPDYYDRPAAIKSDNMVMVVDNVNLAGNGLVYCDGVFARGGGADTVTNSTIADMDYGIDLRDSTAYVANNVVVRPRNDAIYLEFFGSVDGDTSVVRQNQVGCDADGAQNAGGIDIFGGNVKILDNIVGGCEWNIYLAGGDATTRGAIVSNNTVSIPSVADYAGIHFETYHGTVIGNLVTGGGSEGGIGIFGTSTLRPAAVHVANNTVRNARAWGIRSDWVDSILVRGNLVEDYSNPFCCPSRPGAISIGEARDRISVQGNTLRRIHGVGIVVDQNDVEAETVDTATAVIDTNAVSGADTAAVLMHRGNLVMHHNNIRDNARYGVWIALDGYPEQTGRDSLHANAFKGNGIYAVFNEADINVDATGNWWGIDNLPPGSPGTDSTSGSVDGSSPLATEPTDIPALTRPLIALADATLPRVARSAAVNQASRHQPRPVSSVARSVQPRPVRAFSSAFWEGHRALAGALEARRQREAERIALRERIAAARDRAVAAEDSARHARGEAAAAKRSHRKPGGSSGAGATR